MDFKEIKKKLNTFVSNDIKGAKHTHALCECGYSEKNIRYNKIYDDFCPFCGSSLAAYHDYLQIGDIKFNDTKVIIENFNKKDFYRFTILVVDRKGSYDISFKKKEINHIKVDNLIANYIVFDSRTRTKEECFKIYDLVEEKEIDCEKFISNFPELCDFTTIVEEDVHGDMISFHTYYGGVRSLFPKQLITQLLDLQKYCFEPYNEILIKANIDPKKVRVFNKQGKTPLEILDIKKYTFRQLLKYPDDFNTLKLLEKSLGDKSVPYMDKFVMKNSSTWLNSYYANKAIELINEANLSVEKLYKYLYKEAPMNQYLYKSDNSLTMLADCFEMAKQLGLVFDKAPKALVRYHDTLVKEIEICKDELKDKQVAQVSQKYLHLSKYSEFDEEEHKYKDNYSLILPKNGKDIVMEGKQMHHCVGSYVDKMIRERSIILFLRRSDNLETRVATLEYEPTRNAIVQVKGPYNSHVSEDAKKYITQWANEKEIKIMHFY